MQIETKCLHEGYKPENGGPGVMPIVQSTTYRFDSTEKIASLFDMPTECIYSRFANPTCDAVEKKIAALEGGVGAMLTTSGQAASLLSILNLCSAGDSFIAVSTIYGGTINLFGVTLKKLGIECIWADAEADEEEIQKLFKPNTKAVFGETLANPALTVFDIEKWANIAHKNNVPLIVDGGKFDWAASGKFPDFTEPDESYHGVVYTRDFGAMAYIIKARMQLMRDFGCYPSAHSAFLLNMGLETLPVRMKQYCENALTVAKFLEASDKIASVRYPALPGNEHFERAKKYLPLGTSGVMSIDIKGGRAPAMKFMDSLKLACNEVHVADIRTCVLHPASETHRQLTDEQLVAAGIEPGMVRISVGLENVEDIIADLQQALAQI